MPTRHPVVEDQTLHDEVVRELCVGLGWITTCLGALVLLTTCSILASCTNIQYKGANGATLTVTRLFTAAAMSGNIEPADPSNPTSAPKIQFTYTSDPEMERITDLNRLLLQLAPPTPLHPGSPAN